MTKTLYICYYDYRAIWELIRHTPRQTIAPVSHSRSRGYSSF
nr:MAG TPA: hypothetical protein [Bacteriophage sp.]